MNGRATSSGVRWLLSVFLVTHGLIHLLGAAKGLGWANVTQLAEPISTALGAMWGVAAIVTVTAGVLLLAVEYGFASQGPRSGRAVYRRRANAALTARRSTALVTEAGLAHLPVAVAA